MSDDIPVPPAEPAKLPTKLKIGGLNPKAQKLQAIRDKAAGKVAPKSHELHNASSKGSAGFKKTNFQRKAT
jgi:hypothetical protein